MLFDSISKDFEDGDNEESHKNIVRHSCLSRYVRHRCCRCIGVEQVRRAWAGQGRALLFAVMCVMYTTSREST